MPQYLCRKGPKACLSFPTRCKFLLLTNVRAEKAQRQDFSFLPRCKLLLLTNDRVSISIHYFLLSGYMRSVARVRRLQTPFQCNLPDITTWYSNIDSITECAGKCLLANGCITFRYTENQECGVSNSSSTDVTFDPVSMLDWYTLD